MKKFLCVLALAAASVAPAKAGISFGISIGNHHRHHDHRPPVVVHSPPVVVVEPRHHFGHGHYRPHHSYRPSCGHHHHAHVRSCDRGYDRGHGHGGGHGYRRDRDDHRGHGGHWRR